MLMRARVLGNTVPSGKSSLMYVLVVSSQKDGDGLGGSLTLLLAENTFRYCDLVGETAVVEVSK